MVFTSSRLNGEQECGHRDPLQPVSSSSLVNGMFPLATPATLLHCMEGGARTGLVDASVPLLSSVGVHFPHFKKGVLLKAGS